MAEAIFAGISLFRRDYASGKLDKWIDKYGLGAFLVIDPISYYVTKWTSDDPNKKTSPNLSEDTPQITVSAGTPIPRHYGFGLIAGNIVRQNNYKEEDYIKLIVDYGAGPWDEILGHYINNTIGLEDLPDTKNSWQHLGSPTQTGITNVFSSDPCNYRGDVITEFSLEVGSAENSLTDLTNIQTAARALKCLEIGEAIGGTKSWTRNPAQILWDWYVDYKKTPISEMDENAFLSLEEYCNVSCSYRDKTYYQVNVPIPTTACAKSTTHYKQQVIGCALDMNNSVLGTFAKTDTTTWASSLGTTTDQALCFDFGRKVVLTRLGIINYHKSGADTNRGMKNFTLEGSNSETDFSNGTTYSYTGSYMSVGSSMQASEHAADNSVDLQYIDVDNLLGYRYYRMKIADNWGDDEFVGVRHLYFYTGNASAECTDDEANVRYSFDYPFDTKIEPNDAEKLMWQSFRGMIIRSQGKYKPIWDAAEEPDGAGSLQTKTVKHNFIVSGSSGNVVGNSFSWEKIDHPNVFIVNFRNHAKYWKKTAIEPLKNDDDIDIAGEITHEETCYYIIDEALASRRLKFNYNKNTYPDYKCRLTGFPDSQHLEEYDLVTVTDLEAGWNQKEFIIVSRGEDQYGRTIYEMESYLSGIYNDDGLENQGESYQTQTCLDADELLFDDANTANTIDPGGSVEVYITGGVAPFTFATGNLGYDFEGESSYETSERNATLNCASGTVGVNYDPYCNFTIIDACGTECETIAVRNTDENIDWVEIISSQKSAGSSQTYTYDEDIIIGEYRWIIKIGYGTPANSWSYNSDCTTCGSNCCKPSLLDSIGDVVKNNEQWNTGVEESGLGDIIVCKYGSGTNPIPVWGDTETGCVRQTLPYLIWDVHVYEWDI